MICHRKLDVVEMKCELGPDTTAGQSHRHNVSQPSLLLAYGNDSPTAVAAD